MIAKIRQEINQQISSDKYNQIKSYFDGFSPYSTGFRISETPIFLARSFGKKISQAGEEIISQICNGQLLNDDAIPHHLRVPNDQKHFHFLAIDFGICENSQGEIEPQLIELQAFPSLFFYQKELAEQFEKHYQIPEGFGVLPDQKFDKNAFVQRMKKVILDKEKPENVVLLEIQPQKQKTAIDFALTKRSLGIDPICLSEVKKEANELYYIHNGVQTPIYRIYNRVIFDELIHQKSINPRFDLTDEIDADWVTHPNHFFRISKYLLPQLKSEFIPKAYFAHQFPSSENLEDYVLKPLFSFAGKGVIIHPKPSDIKALDQAENYILQQKVNYSPLFRDPKGGAAKAEIRMLYTWLPGEEKPQASINLVRMTKSEKVNVDHLGKEQIWTGSSIAYFEL